MAEGLAARRAALALLSGVMVKGLSLAEQGDVLAGLSPGDRARAQRLALAVMRRAEPIDRILGGFMHKEPPIAVLNILRMAVVELAEGSAAHGVVNSAVELARRDRETNGLAGMINAVLRKVVPPVEIAGPAQRLPGWLRQALVARYGKVAVARMEEVQALAPPVDVTLKAGAAVLEGAEVLPTGSLRLAAGGQVSALPGFAEGSFWVQDAAAALAVKMLGDVRGLSVLDLCAAPGGKTMQLADGGAVVTALDISGPRLGRLRENLARTGLRAEIVTADALQWEPEGLFDAVLLDAPCSATGTVRRHPDLPFLRQASDIPGLVELQARLIDRALGFLKPGGRLVYCTCSLLQDEGEGQIAAALVRHPGVVMLRPEIAGIEAAWMGERGLRLRPDYWAERGGMDGFYMACLQGAG